MPKKQEWTVRVVQLNVGSIEQMNHLPGVWVEQLRYMGHARELAQLDNPDRVVIEFYAPRGTDSRIWAGQNAERMRSFGINAAAAPKWQANDGSKGDEFGGADRLTHMERLNKR